MLLIADFFPKPNALCWSYDMDSSSSSEFNGVACLVEAGLGTMEFPKSELTSDDEAEVEA
jgi:hypothetical protein